jgi:hypothetical protein
MVAIFRAGRLRADTGNSPKGQVLRLDTDTVLDGFSGRCGCKDFSGIPRLSEVPLRSTLDRSLDNPHIFVLVEAPGAALRALGSIFII